jgi:putative N6-adenine-specific DNA methylase
LSLPRFSLFLPCPPGLESVLLEEVREAGWSAARMSPGGVQISGSWPDVWRANLLLRGASRVLVRLGSFRAPSLNVLHGRAKELPWGEFLRENQIFHVEATTRKSKIYHTGAAVERIAKAAAEVTGAVEEAGEGLKILVRIDGNEATVSADSSGELLHRRGYKEDVAGAPLRETMAALFLRACGYLGDETLLDPFCGSGTIPIEAAQIAAGLAPGRARSFAFEQFASFRPDAYERSRKKALAGAAPQSVMAIGSDRSDGAVRAAGANALRAGVEGTTSFGVAALSEVTAPEGPPGLILTNPPYGHRLGGGGELKPLYAAIGQVMRERFSGWRIGLVTANPSLAKATGLKLEAGAPVPHGGLKVQLWQGRLP